MIPNSKFKIDEKPKTHGDLYTLLLTKKRTNNA